MAQSVEPPFSFITGGRILIFLRSFHHAQLSDNMATVYQCVLSFSDQILPNPPTKSQWHFWDVNLKLFSSLVQMGAWFAKH